MHQCNDTLIHQCTDAPIHQCTDTPMHPCANTPMHRCTDAHMHQCIILKNEHFDYAKLWHGSYDNQPLNIQRCRNNAKNAPK